AELCAGNCLISRGASHAARRPSSKSGDIPPPCGEDGRMDEVEVVVAHSERATLRVGGVFLKVDGDPGRSAREVRAMELAPVPTPEVLWHEPPALALAAVPGTA